MVIMMSVDNFWTVDLKRQTKEVMYNFDIRVFIAHRNSKGNWVYSLDFRLASIAINKCHKSYLVPTSKT